MWRMKLFLASLATGVLIVGLMFTALLIVKVLFPGSEAGRLMILIFAWPILFVELSPRTTSEPLVFMFLLGMAVDVVVVSLVSFIIFNVRRTKRAHLRTATLPPPPPGF